jgi:hypothetical protein
MYNYETEKPKLFTDEGQRMFLRVRDHAHKLHQAAGCFTVENAMSKAGGGDSWTMLACVDRLVELGEFKYISKTGATQNWVLQ